MAPNCWTFVPAEAILPRARNRGNRPRGIDLANAVVVPIGDVEVARAVYRHASGRCKLGLYCCTAVPAEAVLSCSRNRGDRPCGIDLANAVVVPIGDVEVARAVHRHASGRSKLGLNRRTSVPAKPLLSRSRNSADLPRGIDLANAVVSPIGDVKVTRAVHRHISGRVKLGLDGRTSVPNNRQAGEGVDCVADPLVAELRLRPGHSSEEHQAHEKKFTLFGRSAQHLDIPPN